MGMRHTGSRNELLDGSHHELNSPDPVMYEVDLPPPLEFSLNRSPDDVLLELEKIGFYGKPVVRGSVDD